MKSKPKPQEIHCVTCDKLIPGGMVNRDIYILVEEHLRMAIHGKSGTETNKEAIFCSKRCIIQKMDERMKEEKKLIKETNDRYKKGKDHED